MGDNKSNPIGDNNINRSLTKIGFFSGEGYLIFVFKKTEKIVSALYLITSLLKDSEPIKWEIREKSSSLISFAIMINDSMAMDKDMAARNIFFKYTELLSLLKIAFIAKEISEMNYFLLKSEIDNLILTMEEMLNGKKEKDGYILSEKFFKTGEYDEAYGHQVHTPRTVKNNLPATSIDKGNVHEIVSVVGPQDDSSKRTDKGQIQQISSIQDKKDNRKIIIINLLKKDSNLTVKDFSRVITDCSEKTIQRELLDLVSKGILKKEGERRWSKYSLN